MIIKKQLFPNENNSTKQFQIFNADDEEPDSFNLEDMKKALEILAKESKYDRETKIVH